MTTSTWLELGVAAMSALALAFSVWSLFVSHTDRLVLQRLRLNGVRHLTVTARVMRDVARCCCAGAMLVAALICLPLGHNHWIAVVTMKVAVLLTSAFLALAVISDFRWRRLIDEAFEAMDS